MKLTPLEPADQHLRQICEPVSKRELRTKAVQAEINAMINFVYGQNDKGPQRPKRRPTTVGLSANQVGIMKQISVVDLAIGRKGFNDVHVLINPRLVWHSKTTAPSTEGCVNLSGIWGEVKRYGRVKVEAWDRSGSRFLIDSRGLAAVLLQHEIDHLNGRLFIDYLPDPAKAMLVTPKTMKNFTKLNRPTWPHRIDVTPLARSVVGSS